MLGSMFAGTDEAPGETRFSKVVNINHIVVSIAAMKKGSTIVTSKVQLMKRINLFQKELKAV